MRQPVCTFLVVSVWPFLGIAGDGPNRYHCPEDGQPVERVLEDWTQEMVVNFLPIGLSEYDPYYVPAGLSCDHPLRQQPPQVTDKIMLKNTTGLRALVSIQVRPQEGQPAGGQYKTLSLILSSSGELMLTDVYRHRRIDIYFEVSATQRSVLTIDTDAWTYKPICWDAYLRMKRNPWGYQEAHLSLNRLCDLQGDPLDIALENQISLKRD